MCFGGRVAQPSVETLQRMQAPQGDLRIVLDCARPCRAAIHTPLPGEITGGITGTIGTHLCSAARDPQGGGERKT
jgi:hypothetical protein